MSHSVGDVLEVTVESLGMRGDGVAHAGGLRLFVPFTVPGDRILVRVERVEKDGLHATVMERHADGPGRREPICRHFGWCGGCAAQHIEDDAYTRWKEGIVRTALSQRGLTPALLAPLHRISPGTRRRARLKARRISDGVAVGFFGPSTHRIVDIVECPILVPRLAERIGRLRAGLEPLLGRGSTAELALTAAEGGVDLVLGLDRRVDRVLSAGAAQLAAAADLARISHRRPVGRALPGQSPEPLIQRGPVQVRFGGTLVDLPPDAFLQPTEEGEKFLADALLQEMDGASRVADLYAGCGAFALRLLESGRWVRAAESAADQVSALVAAARRNGLGLRLEAETRDLNRRPLVGSELSVFDAVVLDPPRPGAPQQAKALAASSVPTVLYVSCNPASFARDARTLADGGYTLISVHPLDQFVFSPHIELVAVFRKASKRRR